MKAVRLSSRVTQAFRYWNTLRFLKPGQIASRLRFRIRPSLSQASLPDGPRSAIGNWQAPIERPVSLLSPGCFSLLGKTFELPETGGWEAPSLDRLRCYNLHYFDDLCAPAGRPSARWHPAWITRWIAENPPREGTGWEPYPTSLRIVNWSKWALAGNELPTNFLNSLALQGRWLARRLEWHLLGNHLFANAKALLFAGMFFRGAEAGGWLRTALDIIGRELPEQQMADGGHFELSPMYHAIFAEDLLDMVNAASAWPSLVPRQVVDEWKERTAHALTFLEAMSHPDGEIGFFNDSAIGIAPNLAALDAYARRLGIDRKPLARSPLLSLRSSGYVRIEQGPAIGILDLARIGPDYLPGHAHADTLSFELSLRGERLIVNGGTSEYGDGPVRQFERGTAAHSTAQIDGVDSSEVWGGFRVARRARPFDCIAKPGPPVTITCAHDGYRRLRGSPVHRRFWQFDEVGMTIEDRVEGPHGYAVARFLLAPGVDTHATGDGFVLSRGREALADVLIAKGRGVIVPGYYAPHFGVRLESHRIDVTLDHGMSLVEFRWR